jgi:hypothetical protein
MIDHSDPSLELHNPTVVVPPTTLHRHCLPPPKENKLHNPRASDIAADYFYCDRSDFILNLQSTTTNQTNIEKLSLR